MIFACHDIVTGVLSSVFGKTNIIKLTLLKDEITGIIYLWRGNFQDYALGNTKLAYYLCHLQIDEVYNLFMIFENKLETGHFI
jgi:hypothetical protein